MKVYGFISVVAVALLAGACSKESAKVSGRFIGHSDKIIYLEQILPGDQKIVDSTRLDRSGDFKFIVEIPAQQPTLFNLRYNNDVIPLMLSVGEKVKINSLCDVSHNYTVDGSPESGRIRELKMLLSRGGLTLDSLYKVIISSKDEPQLLAYKEYIAETNRVKREHLSFIISRPTLLSSLYGLYQRLPNEQYLFNRDNDILYYRMILDSIQNYYPESPYVISLRKEVDAADNSTAMLSLLSQKLRSGGDAYPELILPDMYGNKHMLTSLHGNVILLDFWVSNNSDARLNNGEIRKLYDEFSDKGFEVYQVALDTEKALWISAVQSQKIPWITVCDFRGQASPAAASFNVKRVPTNFLIDRNGNIVGRDLYGDNLAREIKKLMN